MVNALLTPAQKRETANLYESGISLEGCGALLGISASGVRRRLISFGVDRRPVRAPPPKNTMAFAVMIAEGHRVASIAEHFHLSLDAVKRRLIRRGFKRKAWIALFPLSAEETELARVSLDVDGLGFPDTIDLIKDLRSDR